jgi:hypothetical protein
VVREVTRTSVALVGAVAASWLVAACGGGSVATHGPLRPDFDEVWTFGLPVLLHEDAAFGFAVVRDTSGEPVTITGARPIEPSGSYTPLASFVLKEPHVIAGPIVQGATYPPPPMAGHALAIPYTIRKADGRVEVVFGMHFRPPFTDIRFHGIEVDYRVGNRAMKTIVPVLYHLCLHRVKTCSSPPLSTAVKP